MKYIKHPIPEEISDKGGASVQLVQKQTIPLDGAIDAAIEAHYAIGQKEFIRNGVIGTMKSMAAGVRRDGRPRSIEGFLTVFPVFKGPVDLEKGFDPAVNKVQIKARLLNELELDISNWSFEDVTPGKKSFTLNTIKAGPALGVYQIGEVGNLNGGDLPSTNKGEELRVHWEVEGTDKSGDIPAAKLSSDVSRIDIAADTLAELDDEAYDGKRIAFTVRGNYSSARISATLKCNPPPPPPPTPTWDVEAGHEFHNTVENEISGTNLDTARFKVMDIEEGNLHEVPEEHVTSRTATKVVLSGSFVGWCVSEVGVGDGTPFLLCKADGTEAARASCKYILDD